MKRLIASAAIAASFVVAAPATAQTYSGWNSAEFWRGAPADTWQRIDFLQQRIDRGRRDGSLTAAEAARAQRELKRVRREAWRVRRDGRISASEAARVQARLDDVGRNIHWLRHDGVGYGDRGASARFATSYDASRYYHPNRYARERRLTAADQVYRGSDGRYYCKRSDGTIGLVVGGAAGALLGNVIDGGHNRLAGTLIGGALGALAGKAISSNSDVRCR